EPTQEDREHGGRRGGGHAEDETQHAEPRHLVNERAEPGATRRSATSGGRGPVGGTAGAPGTRDGGILVTGIARHAPRLTLNPKRGKCTTISPRAASRRRTAISCTVENTSSPATGSRP